MSEVEQRGRHTLRWCPASATVVEIEDQTPGDPCPACGDELPEAYAPAPRADLEGYIRRAEAFSFSIDPNQDARNNPYVRPPDRKVWEGPIVVVVTLIVVFAGLILFTPSRPDVATVDPADLTAGLEPHERPDAGFAIALPSSWTIADLGEERLLDPDGEAATAMADETLDQFQALVAPGVRFDLLAYGEDGTPAFSVVSRPRARTDTIDRVKYAVESALIWTYGILDPGFELQDVDGHDTLRFTYTIAAPAGDMHVVQYVVMRDSELLTVRFSESISQPEPATFDTIVGTLRTTG